MAADLFVSPPLKNYPSSISPYFSKSLLFRSSLCPKFETGTPFLGENPRQLCGLGAKNVKFGGSRDRRLRAVASLGGLLGGIFKGTDSGEATRQQYAGTVSLINGMEAEMSRLSDLELREKTSFLKERARNGESLDSLLPVSSVL